MSFSTVKQVAFILLVFFTGFILGIAFMQPSERLPDDWDDIVEEVRISPELHRRLPEISARVRRFRVAETSVQSIHAREKIASVTAEERERARKELQQAAAYAAVVKDYAPSLLQRANLLEELGTALKRAESFQNSVGEEPEFQ